MPSMCNYKIYSNNGDTLIAERTDQLGLRYLYTDGAKIWNVQTPNPPTDTPIATLDYSISGFSLNVNAALPDSGGGVGEFFEIDLGNDPNIAYVVPAVNKTTLDLSTLSDIADGTHTVKVKAKAEGYRDSEFSNEVNYIKSSGYTITFNIDYKFSPASVYQTFVKVNTRPSSNSDYTIQTLNGGEISGNNPVSGVTKLYVWGYGYKNSAGEKILLNNSTYNNAAEIPVSSDGSFTVMCTGDI